MSIDPKVKKTANNVARVGARTFGDVLLTILRVIGTILLIIITTGTLFACLFASYVKNSLSDQMDIELKSFTPGLTSIIYATDPNTGGYTEIASLSGKENRIWVSYSEIPKAMEHAAVAIEDKRFYDHKGVDWYRTVGAFGNMFLGMRDTFGASTITQQLIKNVTQHDEVTVQRKLLEIFQALRLEQNYSKEEIMEWYLNSIYLGEGCWGVATAAKEYFGKELSELTTAECACIISITNNPSMYDPYLDKEANKTRQELVLTQMYEQGYIETEAEYLEAMAQPLVFQRAENEEVETVTFSWFVEAVIEDVIGDFMNEYGVTYDTAELYLFNGGYKIYTTLDMNIQAKVDSVYQDLEEIPSASIVSSTQQLRSSIVIVDPYTGNIVALAGDVGEKDGNRLFNYATQMKRPPGSSIKPIAVYAPAIDLGLITPATSFFDDGSVTLKGTDWFPNNDSYSYSGNITVTEAVRRSVNTVAAQVMDLLTPQTSFDFLTSKLGITSLVSDDIAYAPLSLGQLTNGITVREMASAYTCFVNNGVWTESRTYTHITDDSDNIVLENVPESIVAVSEKTAYYTINLMQGVVTGGTGYAARVDNMPTAGKTGASTGWKDRWFVGCTPYYVAAVWSGYEIPEGMGSGNPSTQLFRKVMNLVHEDLEYKEFAVPEGSRSYYSICRDCGGLATEACANTVDGDRVDSILLFAEDAPNFTCECEHAPGGFWSEWEVDEKTGFYIDPDTGYLYDPESEKYYDKLTGWEVDTQTGYLFDPSLQTWVDPNTMLPPDASPSPSDEPTAPPTDSPSPSPSDEPTTPPTDNPPETSPPASESPAV